MLVKPMSIYIGEPELRANWSGRITVDSYLEPEILNEVLDPNLSKEDYLSVLKMNEEQSSKTPVAWLREDLRNVVLANLFPGIEEYLTKKERDVFWSEPEYSFWLEGEKEFTVDKHRELTESVAEYDIKDNKQGGSMLIEDYVTIESPYVAVVTHCDDYVEGYFSVKVNSMYFRRYDYKVETEGNFHYDCSTGEVSLECDHRLYPDEDECENMKESIADSIKVEVQNYLDKALEEQRG